MEASYIVKLRIVARLKSLATPITVWKPLLIMNSLKSLLHSRNRKAGFLVAVVAMALIASVYAYYALLPPQKGQLALITSPPIEFSMELNKADFASDENVTVRLSLKNISNKTITVGMHAWQFHCNSVLTETVDPSEELVSFYTWHQEWDWSGTYIYPVQKGTYHIVGHTRLMHLTVDGQRSTIALETPSITITIK